jgi:iron complex outermembrane receptor protein
LTPAHQRGTSAAVSAYPVTLARRALLLAAALHVCARHHAAAQQMAQIEDVTVTATATPRDPTGTTMLNSADIARTGLSTLGDVLDQIPSMGSQGVNGAQDDGGFGEFFIDLRNLNFDRTLVLVNGSRFVISGIQTDEAVDLNDIPAAFVDHIDVLQDGSQPQYAADAVAGVVNVVLKQHIDGVQLSASGAATGEADSGTANASLMAGRDFTGGNITVGLDAYNRTPVLQSDRAWSAEPIGGTANGAFFIGSPASACGHAVGPGVNDQALGGGQVRPFDTTTDDYNPAGARYLQGGLQHETASLSAEYELTDTITGTVDILATDRSATTLEPPQILGLTGTARNPNGFVIPAANPDNPFGVPVTLERVVSEAGPQLTTTSGPVWRAVAGLNGPAGPWTWSATLDHGQSLSIYSTDNNINLTRALETVGVGPCVAAAGCVPADWFGPGSLSPATLGYLRYTAKSHSRYTEDVAQTHIGGPLFTLPGGLARITLGAELRQESGSTSVDAVTLQGNQAGQDAGPTKGGYGTQEAFTVLNLPLLRDRPLVNLLNLNLAGRASNTTRYGSFETGRAELTYSPAQGLHLRALTATSRRPPAISEAFGGITTAPLPVADPCDAANGLRGNPTVNANCLSQGLGHAFTQTSGTIDVASGGNPALHPEQAENQLLGATLTPPAWPFLSMGADWYQYRIRDAIDSLEDTNPNFIPDVCYASAHLRSPLCRLITRIPGGGNAGQISRILGLDENVGTIKTSGIDGTIGVSLPQTGYGRLKLGWQTTWLLNYRLHTDGVPGFTQYAGSFPGLTAVGSYARLRSRATADWTTGPWSLGWTGRFISGAHVLGETGPFSKAPDVLYQDVDISRRFGRLLAAAGIDNIADLRPPTLLDGETNTDTSTYDVVGRLFWGRVSYQF